MLCKVTALIIIYIIFLNIFHSVSTGRVTLWFSVFYVVADLLSEVC